MVANVALFPLALLLILVPGNSFGKFMVIRDDDLYHQPTTTAAKEQLIQPGSQMAVNLALFLLALLLILVPGNSFGKLMVIRDGDLYLGLSDEIVFSPMRPGTSPDVSITLKALALSVLFGIAI